MLYRILATLSFTLTIHFSLSAQISFTNNNFLIPNHTFHSGVGLGVTDMNNDGLSDIIHLDQGRNLSISYQVPSEVFNTVEYQSMSNSSQWALCIADIDNNSFPDVFSGGNYDGLKIAIANNQGNAFDISLLPGDAIFTQASSFADINNDGYVDIFACHDDGASKIFTNNGDGTFIESNLIDFSTVPVSDNSGNYGAVWTDFDNDGDLDLYIAKCRQGVSDSSDPRRINALFVNDGANNYTEMADEYGLKIGAQSWTADFGDMDNDGDLDCFITNHDVDSQILENDGTGHFTDITSSTNIEIDGLPIQGIWEDFDNDGYLDILVAGTKHSLWRNNGDKTFSYIEVFDENDMESFATGDLNSDGFIDVMGGYANVYTSPSDIDDVIWLNTGNDNNHIAVNLTGMISNKDGIGARIEIYGDWGVQVREVRAGESYGIMNDLKQIFGLGNATIIDQLIVKWPSGLETILTNLDVNQTYNIIEQDCDTNPIELSYDANDLTLCEDEAIILDGPDGYSSYLWNNGFSEQTLSVTEPGNYFVEVTDNNGCISISPSVIIDGPAAINPVISTMDDLTTCSGNIIELTLEGVSDAFEWNTGSTDNSISISENGTYYVTALNNCEESFTSNELELEFITVTSPVIDADTITSPGTYTFVSNDTATLWFENNPPTGEPIAMGMNFETDILNQNITYYAQSFISNDQQVIAGESEQMGSNIFSGGVYNGSIVFNCNDTFVLNSVDVYAELLGERKIIIIDDQENVLHSKLINIEEEGWTTLELGFEIAPAEGLEITTDKNFNNELYGENSPFFARNNANVQYPYPIGEAGEMTSSNFGTPYYYYFYNWDVTIKKESCFSDIVEVNGVYNPDTNTDDLSQVIDLIVYPNPVNNMLFIRGFDLSTLDELNVYDIKGKKYQFNTQKGYVDTSILNEGLYLIELIQGSTFIRSSFIKQ